MGRPLRTILACLALGLGLGAPGLALDLSWDLESGAYLGYAGPWDLSGSLGYGSATTSRIELSAAGPKGPVRVSGRASLETAILTGQAAAKAWALAALPADQVLAPAYSSTSPAPEALLTARLRTAWLRLDPGWASLTLGKQILSYGAAPLWSPVDIFSSLEASGLDTVRRGVDALRLRVPLGDTGMADLVGLPRGKPGEGSYALRLSGLALPGLDLGLLGARRGGGASAQASWLAGADLKLDLGPSFFGELSLAMPDAGGEPVLRAAWGADWSIGDLVLAGEYYWNGGLSPGLDPYGAGSHNAYLSLAWRASDFLSLVSRLQWSSAQDALSGMVLAYLDVAQGARASLYLDLGRSDSASLALTALLGAGLSLAF